MAKATPATSELVVTMNAKGQLRASFGGVPLPGVMEIECMQERCDRSRVRITFIGAAVRLETEKPETV